MAEAAESFQSLLSLEDELTCSICLSPFDCPVTIPCGHNFCQDCLLATWKDSYSCPQCHTLFATRPELKKNTVLSTVVEAFTARAQKSDGARGSEESRRPVKKNVIRCDNCMEAEAAQTCLTCMASFCEEHLRPHRENPTFRLHQLTQPVGDLSEHVCSEHHKLMEHFCTEHGRLICTLCLQQVHKGCAFISPEEQRSLKESDLRDKSGLLDVKIDRTDMVLLQMIELRDKLKDTAEKRKMMLAAVYQQMSKMLAQDERAALHEVDCELETGQTKLRELMKRFTENSERMKTAREEVANLLSQSHTQPFLQASFELPKVVTFDPYTPRVNLDTKRVAAVQGFASALQESLLEIFAQPFEARAPLLKQSEPEPPSAKIEGAPPDYSTLKPAEQNLPPRSRSPGCPPIHTMYQPVHIPVYIQSQQSWNPQQNAQSHSQIFHGGHPHFHGQKRPSQKRQGDTAKIPSARKAVSKPTQKGAPINPGHQSPAWNRQDKKNDTAGQPSQKQWKKPPSTQGGGPKPASTGPDHTKKSKPKNQPPAEKSAEQKQHPKKHN